MVVEFAFGKLGMEDWRFEILESQIFLVFTDSDSFFGPLSTISRCQFEF